MRDTSKMGQARENLSQGRRKKRALTLETSRFPSVGLSYPISKTRLGQTTSDSLSSLPKAYMTSRI